MALKAQYQVSPYVFTGNPIILNSAGDRPENIVKGSKFIISIGGTQVYEGRFFPPLNIDISEIVDAQIPFLPELAPGRLNPVEYIERLALEYAKTSRTITVDVDHDGQYKETYEMVGLPGGLPGHKFKAYALSGTDVFESRFCGPGCNFFFTSRTDRWRLEIKETELYPLYFISTGQIYTFRTLSNKILQAEMDSGVCVLNLDALRKRFVEKYGILPNVFDVETEDGGYCCQIVITHCEPVRERYRLKFRNSFGVFEIMEITGKLREEMEYPDSEETTYRKLDPVSRRFSSLRNRLSATRSFSITTPLDRDREEFVADMLASDEIYLFDVFPEAVRVNVTSDNFSHQRHRENPETISLKMEMTEPEQFFGVEIAGSADGGRPRIHSDEFSNEFN